MMSPALVEAAAVQPASSVAVLATTQPETALPDGVRRMVEAAIASGDAAAITTVLRLARATHAGAYLELDALERRWTETLAIRAANAAEPTPAKPNQGWRTQLEIGASRATGRTSYVGAIGSILVEREGEHWRHKIQSRFELQQGRNVADVERASASWQPSYKFDDQLYLYSLGQAEADAGQEFHARYTAGAGLGYTVLKSRTAKLDLEGGPALRHVDRVTDADLTSLSARASINLRWALLPTLQLNQASALFVDGGDRSANALTSLDAQVVGPLKARFSYDVRYESRLALGSHIDTLSRATLVFSF